jgi:starch synthase
MAFAQSVARDLAPETVYAGMSGASLEPGTRAQSLGGRFVCRRGSAHINAQDDLLREEHAKWGVPYRGIDPWIIARERAEYASADLIEVLSTFAAKTFIDSGVESARLLVAPLGVNLARFVPTAQPRPDSFDILYVGQVSLRKGIPYLLQAFSALDHPRKSLTVVGSQNPPLIDLLRKRGLSVAGVRFVAAVPQERLVSLYSRSHVLVLPSVEDGFGMVMAQAMACGCPVVASTNTGASDLFASGEGWVVPPADADALRRQLQLIADDEVLRRRTSTAARLRVRQLGGWDQYGETFVSGLNQILQ